MSVKDAPRVLTYHVRGMAEFVLHYGPRHGPQLLVIQPLFEEMNRCRFLVASICRSLAVNGIGCWLPDLPGTGESPRALEMTEWRDWREAVQTVARQVQEETDRTPSSVAVRGGALLDDAADFGARWRLSPTSGARLLTDLRRSALAGRGDVDAPAGYRLSGSLAASLETGDVFASTHVRTLRLATDDKLADRYIACSPLWRRAEPVADDALATLLSDDIAAWAIE